MECDPSPRQSSAAAKRQVEFDSLHICETLTKGGDGLSSCKAVCKPSTGACCHPYVGACFFYNLLDVMVQLNPWRAVWDMRPRLQSQPCEANKTNQKSRGTPALHGLADIMKQSFWGQIYHADVLDFELEMGRYWQFCLSDRASPSAWLSKSRQVACMSATRLLIDIQLYLALLGAAGGRNLSISAGIDSMMGCHP